MIDLKLSTMIIRDSSRPSYNRVGDRDPYRAKNSSNNDDYGHRDRRDEGNDRALRLPRLTNCNRILSIQVDRGTAVTSIRNEITMVPTLKLSENIDTLVLLSLSLVDGRHQHDDDNRRRSDDDYNRRAGNNRDRYGGPSRRDNESSRTGKFDHLERLETIVRCSDQDRGTYRNRDDRNQETNDLPNHGRPSNESVPSEPQSRPQAR